LFGFGHLGAFFAVSPQKTGLSACIFFASGKKGYRFYPLREPKPLRGFGFAEFHCVKLQGLGSLGQSPKLRKPKTHGVFGSASMPACGVRLGSFAPQNSRKLSLAERF
jgi:hypothetical protein